MASIIKFVHIGLGPMGVKICKLACQKKNIEIIAAVEKIGGNVLVAHDDCLGFAGTVHPLCTSCANFVRSVLRIPTCDGMR